MTINKKIKNATSVEYDGIQFKSKLEVTIYKTLKEKGLNPLYECNKFILQDKETGENVDITNNGENYNQKVEAQGKIVNVLVNIYKYLNHVLLPFLP